MRKLLCAVFAFVFMAGLVVAAEVTVSKVDVEKKEVTVKEGDKEATYKYTDKVKVTLLVGKDATEKEGKFEDFEGRLKAFKADAKFATKLNIETKDGEITTVKFRSRAK